ncbi:MAG: hypothetical protein EA417_13285 [Gammaproteobacteria bacterium]|nr:MAG: hypothetical protein EA417_13285 [Gammaproteobacteria bacterium]
MRSDVLWRQWELMSLGRIGCKAASRSRTAAGFRRDADRDARCADVGSHSGLAYIVAVPLATA